VEHEGRALNVGPDEELVRLPSRVLAPALDRVKVSAGVVVGVATEVVNNGDRLPAVNVVTPPPPPPVKLQVVPVQVTAPVNVKSPADPLIVVTPPPLLVPPPVPD
jgi:hypothetical protein